MRDLAITKPKKVKSAVLRTATAREFDGGWNVIDNELNLSTRFGVLMDNVSRDEDGSIGVRGGTVMLGDIRDSAWTKAADFNPVTFTTFTQTGTANGATTGVTLANPNAWHDANVAQARAACTSITSVATTTADSLNVTLQLTMEVSPNIVVDMLQITRPTDGWYTGSASISPSSRVDIILETRFITSANWTLVRRNEYTISSLPTQIQMPIRMPGGADHNSSNAHRITFVMPLQPRNTTVTFAVAEVAAFSTKLGSYVPWKTYIVNITYFQNSAIIVLSSGVVLRMLGDGTVTNEWSGWGPTEFASFAVFNGDLIICNGTDKPLIANFDKAPNGIDFLVDLGTTLNTNTPICRYVVAASRFLVMAGDPLEPNRIYISQESTSGTWFGDPEPNNATNIDLGSSGVPGDQIITGLNTYRESVVVGFPNALVLGKLGAFDEEGVHLPLFNDLIENIGCHSHRSMANLGKDLFMLDNNGVPSVARSLYSGSVEPKRVSELIDPAVGMNVSELVERDILLGSHATYNATDKQYMLFVPNHSEYDLSLSSNPLQLMVDAPRWLRVALPAHNMLVGEYVVIKGATSWNNLNASIINNIVLPVTHVINKDYFVVQLPQDVIATTSKPLEGGGSDVSLVRKWTETYGYIYTFVDELKVRAWSRFRGWRWRASCSSELGTALFADDNRVFAYSTPNTPLYMDFIKTELVRPIEWIYEQPWTDFGERMMEKHTRYISFDTSGTGRFVCMMFVDRIYKINGVLQPNTAMEFVGGDTGGYGDGIQAYGGGRNTSDERQYAWTNRMKIGKLRFQGVAAEPLRIVAISLAYMMGRLQR